MAAGALKGLSKSVAAVDGELQATKAKQGKLDEQRRQQEKARDAQMATNAERAAAMGQWRKRSTELWEDARVIASRGEEEQARVQMLGRMDKANNAVLARREKELQELETDSKPVIAEYEEVKKKVTGVAAVANELREEAMREEEGEKVLMNKKSEVSGGGSARWGENV